MEQLDFLLIFTMDVKTYSCAIWYLQFMFEESELGKHMGERWWAPSKHTGNILEVKPKMRGSAFLFQLHQFCFPKEHFLEVGFCA